MQIRVRNAQVHELTEISQKYQELLFEPISSADTIAVIDVGEEMAGFGRIIAIDEDVCQLDGMYIYPEYRGNGLSHKLIAHLIQQSHCRILYCIPFAAIESLYNVEGFRAVFNLDSVTLSVRQRFERSKEQFPQAVLLMRLIRRISFAVEQDQVAA